MPKRPSQADPRGNQRLRTRKDLLAAASRLLRERPGVALTMDEVARAAMVSRATAYRYFPRIEDLLVEAPLDGAVPTPGDVFGPTAPRDPAERVELAEAALHEMCQRNETQLRMLLAASLLRTSAEHGVPVRQNRRSALIEAALEPARPRLSPAAHKRLSAALALIFGVESMVVFTDVLGMDARAARKVKSWALRALVHAALAEVRDAK